MIIWGFGKVTKKKIGGVFSRMCTYCNTEEVWQLCIMRTWFTLFFIPIIPYSRVYCISCPNCGSYMEISKEDFLEIKSSLQNGTTVSNTTKDEIPDEVKYRGKNETQINFLKEMEKANKE